MNVDESGRPTGFEPAGRTLLRATAALIGNVLTLGDGASVRGLAIQDVVGRLVPGSGVAVLSRAAGDFISARIEECEIINPNPPGNSRGLVVMNQNPNLEPPHEGAVLRVQMTRSIVRSPGGANGIFAINFASHSAIRLDLESNVVGGGLSSAGGVGLPDAVTQAGVVIQSSHNLYRSDSLAPTGVGWQLFAGADAPIPLIVSEASTFNTLQMHSMDDTLTGFATGIVAAGGRRINALSATISSNRVELNLHGTLLQTTTADLRLSGATTMLGVSTGDDNTAHVLLVQATGSGVRANRYAHSSISANREPRHWEPARDRRQRARVRSDQPELRSAPSGGVLYRRALNTTLLLPQGMLHCSLTVCGGARGAGGAGAVDLEARDLVRHRSRRCPRIVKRRRISRLPALNMGRVA